VSGWNDAVRQFKSSLPVALLASSRENVGDQVIGNVAEPELIKHAADINRNTLQEQIAPFLERLRIRQRVLEVFTRVPDREAWLGFSTSATRHLGVDYNSIYIYYKDPTGDGRTELDTFVNWNEGITLLRATQIVRRVFEDDVERRSLAMFDADRLIADFRAEVYRIAGR
jgi:hypothetical protein